jgi:beta-N-acetylhexosaminidase
VLAGYTDEDWIPKITAQIVFGGLPAQGSLPFTISNTFKEGQGFPTIALNRFSYSLPEAAGFDSKTLEQINAIAREAIDSGATPGSSILVARGGKVIYEYANGWLTYENKDCCNRTNHLRSRLGNQSVGNSCKPLCSCMRKGLIDVNKKAAVYLPELKDFQ